MFSCIYFVEDCSLSIVGRKDKNLKLLGNWKPKEQVEMKWGKKLFHGTIIKTDDKEETLTKFANSANSKILKKERREIDEDFLESLFTFAIKEKTAGGKRNRTQTTKLKESLEQEEALSPSKKKKNVSTETGEVKTKTNGSKSEEIMKPGKLKVDKKKKEEKTSLIIYDEINDLCDQFVEKTSEASQTEVTADVSKSEKGGKGKSEATTIEDLYKENQNGVSLLTTSDTPVNISKDTPFSKTWEVCNAMDSDIMATNDTHDAPPQEVISFFQLLLLPTVRTYIEKMVERFSTTSAQDNHQQLLSGPPYRLSTPPPRSPRSPTPPPPPPQPQFITLEPYNTNLNETHLSTPNTGYTQPVCQYSPIPESCFSQSSYNPQVTSKFQKNQNPFIPQLTHMMNAPTPYGQPYNQYTSSFSSSQHTPSHVDESSNNMQNPYLPVNTPATIEASASIVHSNSSSENSNQNRSHVSQRTPHSLSSATPHTVNPSPVQIPPHQTPRRTSPRKQQQQPRDIMAEENHSAESTCKLMENRSLRINKDLLRSAVRLSKKSKKPGYTLTMKLLPGLFSNEQMAQSKGQGILTKKDDLRAALDKEKISTIKEYVVCWCKANGLTVPDESDLNAAITERISYARKILKQTIKKPKNTD